MLPSQLPGSQTASGFDVSAQLLKVTRVGCQSDAQTCLRSSNITEVTWASGNMPITNITSLQLESITTATHSVVSAVQVCRDETAFVSIE
eukprot:768459-Hanusia_phi.AAC.11